LEENKSPLVEYWIEKSKESLHSAELEFQHGSLNFSVNRLYYSIFYIVNAYFFLKGKSFKKHAGVKSAFHKDLIKTNTLDKKYGKLYDVLFEAREEGDYKPFIEFEKEQVEDWIGKVKNFVKEMEILIEQEKRV